MSVFDAAMRYKAEGVPLVVFGGSGIRHRGQAVTGLPREPVCSACAL